MDLAAQLKLQAWLDGELPEAEARAVADWVAREPEASALAEELRQTRRALAGFEADLRLPESREFFWSKIEREIARRAAPARVPAPRAAAILAGLRRCLIPATAAALLVLAGAVLIRPGGAPTRGGGAEVEMALADAGAFTYCDYSAGTTLVWFSYPADN